MGLIFSPFPSIDAVSLSLSNTATSFNANTNAVDNTINLEIVVKDPAAVTFPDSNNAETITNVAILRVTMNPGESDETVALFDIPGNRLANSKLQSGQTADTTKIVSLVRDSITRVSNGAYGNLGYGYFYGFGYGYFNTGFGNGQLGTGVNGYGITSNAFNADTKAAYTLKVNPDQLATSNTIKVDVLPSSSSSEFFTSGSSTFTNTITGTVTVSTVPTGGNGTTYNPPSSLTTLNVESSSLPATIQASTGQKLDFSSAPTFTTTGSVKSVTISDNDVQVASTVSGKAITVDYPADVVVSAPAGWSGKIAVPTITTVAAPEGQTSSVVFEVGDGNTRLTFDKAIKLVIPGESGKNAFFKGTNSKGNVVTQQLTLCSFANTQAAANAGLSVDGLEACYLNVSDDMNIWTKHFSSFGSSSTSASSSSSSSSSSSRGGGGGGHFGSSHGGGGGSGGSASSRASTPGVSGATLYEVEWDVCEANTMRIIAGPATGNLGVKLRTSAGLITAERSVDQSYPGRIVFDANLPSNESFVYVTVENIESRGASVDSKGINFSECSGSQSVNKYSPIVETSEVTQITAEPIASSTNVIPGLTPVKTPEVVHEFITEHTNIVNDNTGMELTEFQTLQSNVDKYAEIVLGISGQTTTTVALMDRPNSEESNNNANLFLQFSSVNSQVNSMRAVLLGGDTIEILAGDGSKTIVPISQELEIPSVDPVEVSQKSSMKVNSGATQIKLSPVVEDFLNTNIEFTNESTGDSLTKYMVLQSVPDVFAEKELGISGQDIVTIAFTDRYGRSDSNGDLNVFTQISYTDEQVNSLRYVQLGGDKISATVNGVEQEMATQTIEIPLN